MPWYTASLITAIKYVSGPQEVFPVFEDFYVVEAHDVEAAYKKAEAIGQEGEKLEDGLELNGKPATRHFLGIRKLRSVFNLAATTVEENPPEDGTEVSHSYFEVYDEADLQKLADGKRVTVSYVDDSDD